MSFRDMVANDLHNVFLNPEEFAVKRTVKYDGAVYENVVIVTSENRQETRDKRTENDHAQGLHQKMTRVHIAISDIGGKLPEMGTPIWISVKEGGAFLQKYYVEMSKPEMGMAIMELKAVDE